MRTLFLSLLCLFGALSVLQAQDSSYGIAYQAVARDADGDPLADVELQVRVTLQDGDGTSLWQEEHASVLTNQFGNIALTIGAGTSAPGSATLGDIDWSLAGLHFEIEVDAGAGYASFGDVAVQAVPVAMYAQSGWEGDIDGLYSALDAFEGDYNAFVSATNAALTDLSGQASANAAAIADESQARADQDAVLLGLIESNDGEISILQTNVATNTADLGDILSLVGIDTDASTVTIGQGVTLQVTGTLALTGTFTAGTGLFNYLSAQNADFEEMAAEDGLFGNLTAGDLRVAGPDSHLEVDGTFNVDGDATFGGSVSGTDGELASQNYVDGAVAAEAAARAAADAALQADVDQNEADSDAAEAQLQANIDAEAAARAAADAALQADVDQNEADSDAAEAQLQANIDAEEAARIAADAALQADVDQNEADSDAAEAQLQSNIDAEASARAAADAAIQADVDQNEADGDAADANLQGQIDDNEFRIGAAASDMGFVTTTVGGVDNTPAHPGYTGTNYIDGEGTLVGADEALDAAIKAEADRAMAAEAANAADIAQNASDIAANLAAIQSNDGDIADLQTALQAEVDRATAAEGAIQADVDQNESDSDDADTQLQNNINAEAAARIAADAAIQADVDQNESDSDAAEAQLQSNIDAEASARAAADATLQSNIDAEESARIAADNNLQGQIDGNDLDISNLQTALSQEVSDRIYAQQQLNFAIQNNQGAIQAEANTRASEDAELLALINGLQADVLDGDPVDAYFDHLGTVVYLDSPWSAIDMQASDIQDAGLISADELDAQYLDVDDAEIQNLTIESNLTSPNASIGNQLNTQYLQVWEDADVDGDLSVAGAVDFGSTLTVAGETTLNDNTVINGDLTVNGNVTAHEATADSHLPTYGQVTYIADTLQDNIDAEEAARIAADNNLQSQITSNDGDIAALDTRVTTNEGDITSLEGRMDTAEGDIVSLEGRMDTAEGDITALDTRVTANEGDIASLEGRMDTAEGDITALEGRMDTAEGDITALEGRMDTAEGDITALEGRMDTAEGEIDQLQSDVVTISDSLQANIDDERVRAMAAEALLQQNIDAEEAARIAADNAISDSLQQNINDERVRAMAAEALLQQNIDAEEAARIAADNAISDSLQENIDDERARAMAAEALLQQNIDAEEAARIAADILISDSLQENIDDEVARAMQREAELQAELDATQTGAGLNEDGTYTASSARWIDDATSLKNADDQLSAVADSIEQNLWWNMGAEMYTEGETEINLDAGIGNLDINNTDIHARSIWADGVHTDYVGAELIIADEAILEEISTDDLNAGVADIGTLRWTHGRAVGSNSTTDLDGTLNVDGRAWFRSNVYLDSNLYVNQDIYVDTIKNLTADGLVLQSDNDIILDAGDTEIRGYFDDLYFYAESGLAEELSTVYFEMEPDSDEDADAELTTQNHFGQARLWLDVDDDGDDMDAQLSTWTNYNSDFQLYSRMAVDADGDDGFAEGKISVSDDWYSGETAVAVEWNANDSSSHATLYSDGMNGYGSLSVNGYNAADSVSVNIDADNFEVSAPADFNTTVNIDGNADLQSALDVDGATTLNNTLDVDGQTELNDSLHVDGNVDFDSNLNVDGNTTLVGDLDVDGSTTLDGLNVSEDASFDMNVDITGDMTVDDASGDSLDFNFAELDKILSDTISNVTAAGLVFSSSSDIRLFGDSVVSNAAIFANSTLDVDGATTLNSTLDVDGQTELNDSLHVDGNVDFDSELNVDGHTELNDSLHVDGNVDFDSNLNVDGDLNVNGNSTLVGDLDVDGRTTLDSTWVAEHFQFDGPDFDVNASDEVTVNGNTIDLDVTDAEISMSTEEIEIALPNSGSDYSAEILLWDDAGDSQIDMSADYLDFDAYQTDIWSDDDINMDTNGDLWVEAEESIEIFSNEDDDGYHGLYIDVEDDNDPMVFLPEADSDYEVELYSDDAISVNANYDAGLELNADINAALLYGDSVLIDGRFVVRDNADFYSNVEVDGATYLNGALDVDGATTLNSTLDVDGQTELNDSLHVDGNVDFDSELNVDGHTELNSTLDVDGQTELNDSLHVDGNVDFDSELNVDGHTELNSTLDVDGATTLNDSLDVDLHTELNSTLNVDGFSNFNDSVQFNDNINIDATMTTDSAIVEESMKIYTPAYPGLDAPTLSEPEFEILNVAGDPIFEVDGHNDDVIAENLTVNGVFTTQDWIVNDDISADDISAAGVVTAGNTTYGSEWGTGAASPNNWLTRKDYVDFHRQAATGVLQAFSYDADLIGGATGADYNESVYYMNGDLVLYADSVESANSKNYTITVKGENFSSLVDEDGAPLTIEAAIWAENNELAITAASHNLSVVDDNTITFELGYDDINGIVACTSGKVRPTLALGSATYGMQMTGLHFFIEIEEAAAID